MLQNIVLHTNEEISRRRLNEQNLRKYHSLTDEAEIRAFTGLLYIAEADKSGRVDTADLWCTKRGHPMVRVTMTRNRFNFLTSTLRFDDKETRSERRANDRLAPIRELRSEFISRCTANCSPSEHTAIDKQLLAFRGRCIFRMYIPSKPGKYGLKSVTFNDAKTFYLINAMPYIGKLDIDKGESAREYYVRTLTSSIHNTGRNTTVDNWFTSVRLFDDMLKTHRCTMVGTIRKNKRELPAEFLKPHEAETSQFAFDENKTLVAYYPKKGKVVKLLSTMHYDDTVDPETNKPEILMFYNKTKGSTDTFDQLCTTYSTA